MKGYFIAFLVLIFFVSFGLSSPGSLNKIPPNGYQIFLILLSNLEEPLSKNVMCSGDNNYLREDKPRLLHQLAANLALSFKSCNQDSSKVEFGSSCKLDQYLNIDGKPVEGWACMVYIIQKDKKNEWVANATISFFINLKKNRLVEGSLKCM